MASSGGSAGDGDSAQSGLVGGSLLRQILDYLKTHPPLLYGIAGALVLLSVFGVAAGQPLLAILVVLILLAGLAAWLIDARSARAAQIGTAPPPPIFAPRVRVGDELEAEDDARFGAQSGATPGIFRPRVKIGRGAKFGNRASVGSSDSGGSERRDPPPEEDTPGPSSTG